MKSIVRDLLCGCTVMNSKMLCEFGIMSITNKNSLFKCLILKQILSLTYYTVVELMSVGCGRWVVLEQS